jgi:hypothetical protein
MVCRRCSSSSMASSSTPVSVRNSNFQLPRLSNYLDVGMFRRAARLYYRARPNNKGVISNP